MERIINNIEQYANGLVEKLIYIRDHYDLSREDRDALADVANLIDHNLKNLEDA
jgi:hypothetical protein